MILIINQPILLGGIPSILKECFVIMVGYEVQPQKCNIHKEEVFTELLCALEEYSDYVFMISELHISVEPKCPLRLTYK